MRSALSAPDHSHRDPEFRACLHRVLERLPRLLGGAGTHDAVMFASSGTGATEAIVSSIRGRVLLLQNGRYSERIGDIAERYGLDVARVIIEPYAAFDIPAIEARLVADAGLTHLALVHHETTTGVLAPLRDLGAVAARHGRRLVVDAVSSVGGTAFDLCRDGVTLCSINPNKCLEGVPGIAFVLARRDELAALEGCSRSFYFDLHAQWSRAQRAEVPYTAPVQIAFAFDVALRRLEEEGYDRRVARYAALAERLRQGLRRVGLQPIEIPEAMRSDIVVPVRAPAGLDFPALHDFLQDRAITIYSAKGALADGRFFLSAMGAIGPDEVDRFLQELALALSNQGVLLSAPAGAS